MDKDASFDVDGVVLSVPVGLESNGDAIPSVWVDVTQSVAAGSDDSLCQQVRLLLQVMMMSIRVVERSSLESTHDGSLLGHEAERAEHSLLLHS